ncbi:MAG: DUF4402 domain-containing protein [Sphingomicrobium sp.]
MRYLSVIGPAALAMAAMVATPAAAATPSATVSGKALLLVPLSLVKIDDLDFGGIIPSGVSGAVSLNATTGVRSFAGGVTGVPGDIGKRGYFGGAGTPNQQVIVTIDAPTDLVNAASDTIPVLGLTMDGPALRTIDPVTRTFYVGIGGTLLIGASQPDGIYSATFDVTAYYQ